ncbi:unnamed protein product, partial [Mesorhabditis belari]|uniref:Saposin B-type domain-containing protein n=1 Tax=Mesorhabditis belari TaxID=2138241 RepID=A0AAF3FC62_9BILA
MKSLFILVVFICFLAVSFSADREFCVACEPFINDVVEYKNENPDKFVDKTRKACTKRFNMVYPTFCKTLVTPQIDDIRDKLQKNLPVKQICRGLRMC